MNVVLINPEIAPNCGNVARLCAVTGAVLHLVEPLGFRLDDSQLRRAGMDYWDLVEWHRWVDWKTLDESIPPGSGKWFIESGAPRSCFEVEFRKGDFLVFGRETAGLPQSLLHAHEARWVHIPMRNPAARS